MDASAFLFVTKVYKHKMENKGLQNQENTHSSI